LDRHDRRRGRGGHRRCEVQRQVDGHRFRRLSRLVDLVGRGRADRRRLCALDPEQRALPDQRTRHLSLAAAARARQGYAQRLTASSESVGPVLKQIRKNVLFLKTPLQVLKLQKMPE